MKSWEAGVLGVGPESHLEGQNSVLLVRYRVHEILRFSDCHVTSFACIWIVIDSFPPCKQSCPDRLSHGLFFGVSRHQVVFVI